MKFSKNKSLISIGILLIAMLFGGSFYFYLSHSTSSKSHHNTANQKVNAILSTVDSLEQSNPTRAIELLLEAEEIAETAHLDQLRPLVSMAQGELYFTQTDYPKALQHFLQAKNSYNQTQIKAAKTQLEYANCLNQISKVYFSLDRTQKALGYLKESLSLYQNLEQPEKIARTLRNMGGIYFKEGQFEKALNAYQKALVYYESVDSAQEIQRLYSNLGAVNLIQGDKEKSIIYFELAENKINEHLEVDPNNESLAKELSMVLYNKACYFNDIGQPDRYAEYLEESHRVLGDIYAPAEAHDPLFNLHQLHRERGEYVEAYDYLLQYQSARDSLFNIENNKKIAELEIQQELFAEQQAFEHKKRKSERRYWISLASLMTLLLLVLAYSNRQKIKIINTEKEKQRLAENKKLLETRLSSQEVNLSKKESEIRQLVAQIVEKNKNISTLQHHVDQINNSVQKHLSQNKINKLIKNTRESQDLEADRKQLLLSLEQSSVGMFQKLENDFTGITDRQKHLAALVKYKFTAKEISVLFNISHKSVQTAKYRLKKFMMVPSDQDLDTFLQNY